MKKYWLGLVALATLAVAPAFAADWAAPGALNLEAGVGYNTGFYGVSAEVGAEVGLFQLALAPQFKLNFGLKGVAATYIGGSGLGLAAEGYLTINWGLKQLGLGIDFLNRLNYFIGFGTGIGLLSNPGPLFAYSSGISYDLSNSVAVFVGYQDYTGSLIGFKLKL